jgi:hypothetical protein
MSLLFKRHQTRLLSMAKSKAQEEVGSSENGKLDTVEREKPELISSSIEDGDEKLPPFWANTRASCFNFVIISSIQ